MIILFFKTAIRNLRRDKTHSILNILGLAIGLTAFLYIISFIVFEASFDRFHSKANQIFRCCADIKFAEDENTHYASEAILASTVKQELPEIEVSTRIYSSSDITVRYNENKFSESQLIYADDNIFQVFDFELLKGDKNTSLLEPYSIILTENAANKYFGDSSAMNKTLILGEDKRSYTVTGILKAIPNNSHLQFNMVASLSSISSLSRRTDWGGNFNFMTYLVLKEKTDIHEFEKKYSSCIRNYWAPLPEEYLGITLEEFEKQGKYFKHWLQPLSKIHLHSKSSDINSKRGSIQLLIILGITGLLIIVIACVNFINLSTARSNLRLKEIRLKKILGSERIVLIFEILSESLLQCFLALILSFTFLQLLLPVFNNYSGIELTNAIFLDYHFLAAMLFLLIILTLFSGGYLAFGVTKHNAIYVEKQNRNKWNKGNLIQGSLVSFQFVVFILLVISSIVIRKQINFLQNQSPGFNQENVLVLKNVKRLGGNMQAFKNELLNQSNIISASYSSAIPTISNDASNLFSRKGDDNAILMDRIRVDYDFFKTLEIKSVNGRFFNENFSDDNNIIMNKKAASLLGWNDCNQKQVHYYQGNPGYDLNLIGIVENFHLESFHEDVKPLVIFLNPELEFKYLSLKISQENLHSNLDLIQEKLEKFGIDVPVEYFLLDNSLVAQYKSENQLADVIGLFTILAIAIAVVGLVGLVSFMVNRRQKEIGIRKVNGAKTREILILLNKGYLRWIVISYFIACPIAWVLLNKWLQNFVYRTTIGWGIFAFTGTMALLVTLLIVSWQSWTSANKNPVDALRCE